MIRGHQSSMYLDMILLGLGAYLALVQGDWGTGGVLAIAGLGIHVVMGD